MDGNKKTGNVGDRIKELREKRGLTQDELSKKLYVKRETVNQWEHGTRQIKDSSIVQLADALQTSCDYLLCHTDIESPNIDIQAMCAYSGLSEAALQTIIDIASRQEDDYISGLNVLLVSDTFVDLLPHVNAIVKNASSASGFQRLKEFLNADSEKIDELLSTYFPDEIDLAQFRASTLFTETLQNLKRDSHNII